MAEQYFISSREEAEAYLEHPVLGFCLQECNQLAAATKGRSIEDIFGYTDHLKNPSSMILFPQVAADNEVFNDCLRRYFNSESDSEPIIFS